MPTSIPPSDDPFLPPDAGAARAEREFVALTRITERHVVDDTWRHRTLHPAVPEPYELVSLVAALAGGRVPLEADEAPVDDPDITAALTLMPRLRTELDALELALLSIARGRGLTWQAIAFGLGLGTPQAAKQRYERLAGRTKPEASE